MKAHLKCVAVALAFLGCTAFASSDGLKIGGYGIYSSFLGIQTLWNTDGTTTDSGITTKTQQWWNFRTAGGRAQINMSYTSGDVAFLTSFRLDEDLLNSYTTLAQFNPINTANIAVKAWDGQLKFRTGLYQEEGLGYQLEGFASGVMGRYLASNHGGGTDTNYLTSVEILPEEIPELHVLVGIPLGPTSSVFGSTASETSTLLAENVYKRFRITAMYDLTDVGVVHAFWYNAVYGNGSSDFTSNNATEGINEYFVGLDKAMLADLPWKFGFEVQNLAAYSAKAYAFTGTASTQMKPIPGWTLTIDNVTTMFNKDWALAFGVYQDRTVKASSSAWADSKWGLVNKTVVQNAWNLKPFEIGINTAAIIEPFSNGHMDLWGQPVASLVDSDVSQGNEVSVVASPYFKYAIGQGTVTIGVDLMVNTITVGDTTNSALGWRVPVDFFFWF